MTVKIANSPAAEARAKNTLLSLEKSAAAATNPRQLQLMRNRWLATANALLAIKSGIQRRVPQVVAAHEVTE